MDAYTTLVLVLIVGYSLLVMMVFFGADGVRRQLIAWLGRRGVILLVATGLTIMGCGGLYAAITRQAELAWVSGLACAFGPIMVTGGVYLFVIGLTGRAERADQVARALIAPDMAPSWQPIRPPPPPPVPPPPALPISLSPTDRAFLARLAAAPADDTSRLVYADWLAEQDDPREPVLRAAVTQPDRAVPLPIGVDPVWAAAVRHPPFGVLVPGLTFTDAGPPVDPAALPPLWPLDLRAFLLLHNGGTPSRQPHGVTLRFLTAAEIAGDGWPRDWDEVDLVYHNPLVIARAESGEFTGYLAVVVGELVESVRRGDEPPTVERFTGLPEQSLAEYLAGLAACPPAAG